MNRMVLSGIDCPTFELLESRLLLSTYAVPLTIPYDYSVDVTSQLQSFINSVPNNNTIAFPALVYDPATVGYKVEGTLTISGRSGLIIEGNGAIVRAFDPLLDTAPNVRTRSQWRVNNNSSNITLQNLIVYGINTTHDYDSVREAQHAFDIVGGANNVLIDNIQAYETFGDGVYIGGSNNTRNVTVQNSHIQYTGRQGIAPCQGDNILIQNNWIGDSRRGLIDIEPYAAGWMVDNIRILNNTLGNSRLLTFPMAGGGDYGTVMIANNIALGSNGTPKIDYGRSNAPSRRGPFILVNNQLAVGGSPAPGIELEPVDGVFIAGNSLTLPSSRSMTGVRLTDSRGAVIGNNFFSGAATAISADALSTPLWQWDDPISGSWSNQTVMGDIAGSPGCYYATVPYTGGGQVIAIWRVADGTTAISYGGLTTTGDYAVVRVDAGGAFVDGWGFNGASSYNGQDLGWLKPNAPSGLTATTASSSQINLAWTDNMSNESGFRIERSPDGLTGWAQVGTTGANVTTYQDSSGLVPGTTYYYRVRTYNALADSAPSNVASAAPTNVIPTAPTGLTLTVISDGRIDLAWNDNSNNETGFKIERSPNGSSWTQIATVGVNIHAYANTGLTGNTPYYYRVRAYNVVGNSAYTNVASATTSAPTIPSAPASLTATTLSPNDVSLAWTDNDDNETGFRIERAPDSGGAPGAWTEIGTVATDVTTYNVSGLSASTTYYFRVRAYNVAGQSAYSNTAAATTMQVTFSETWSGANGSPWPAVWTFEGGALTTRDIQGSTGHIYSSGGASTLAYYNALSCRDSLQTVSLEGNLNGPKFGLIARRADSTGTYYAFQTDMIGTYGSSDQVYITKHVSGVSTVLYTATLAYNVDQSVWWKLKFQVQQNGSTTNLKAKIWRASDSEPLSWTISISDSTAALQNRSGMGGLWLNPSSNRNIYADNYAVTSLDPPAAPSGLTATAASASRINLSWADNSNNEAGFRIERSPDGTTGWTQITAVGAGVTSYADTSVSPATTYYYRVYAFHSAANSGYTNTASATTPDVAPAAPSGLGATAASATQIDLAWTDNAGNESGFRIERSPDGSTGWTEIATVGASVTSYGDSGLSGSTSYWYRLRAYNGAGESGYSNVANATTEPLDSVSPTVLSAVLNGGAEQRSKITTLAVQFSEAVVAAKGDLTLTNRNSSSVVDIGGATFAYNAGSRTATWDFSALDLADAYYRATLSASAVQDLSGNPLDGDGNGTGGDDYAYLLFKQGGDTTGDAAVNVLDLGVLGAHYGQSGANIPGDMNADGTVNVIDLGILGAHYGQVLPIPAPPAGGQGLAAPQAAQVAPAGEAASDSLAKGATGPQAASAATGASLSAGIGTVDLLSPVAAGAGGEVTTVIGEDQPSLGGPPSDILLGLPAILI